MAISEKADIALQRAAKASDLECAVVIGKGGDGKIQLFLADCDREKLIVLLERARNQLVRSLD